MQDWFIFLQDLEISPIFALAIALAITHGKSYAVKMQIAFAVSVGGYVLAPTLHGRTGLFYLSAAISETAPR